MVERNDSEYGQFHSVFNFFTHSFTSSLTTYYLDLMDQ